MGQYLGVDIGGTNLRAAVATEPPAVAGRATTATPQKADAAAITEAMTDAVERACADAGCAPSSVAAAGIGSVGPLDTDAGAIEGPSNITGTERPVPLVESLRGLLGTDRIVLRNDAVCGVVAESHFADTGADNLVYLTVSTGIGAGVIVDGNVLSGADGNVGEVGHLTLDPDGRMRCGCGKAGHWEAYAGGANMPDYARELHREQAIETELPVDAEGFSAAEIFAAAGEDALADRVLERVSHWNALGVANLIHAFAPSEIAVGGAVALNNPEAVVGPIRRNVGDHLMVEVPDIHLSASGEDVVLYGAILSAKESYPEA
jgi:glucokinase